jgi:hypothetical protein
MTDLDCMFFYVVIRFHLERNPFQLIMRRRRRVAADSCNEKEDSYGCPRRGSTHGRTARGCHGLPKVSSGPAMPYLSPPLGRATPKIALRPFQGWHARRAGCLQPSSTPLDTPRHTPMGPQTPPRMVLLPSPEPYPNRIVSPLSVCYHLVSTMPFVVRPPRPDSRPSRWLHLLPRLRSSFHHHSTPWVYGEGWPWTF